MFDSCRKSGINSTWFLALCVQELCAVYIEEHTGGEGHVEDQHNICRNMVQQRKWKERRHEMPGNVSLRLSGENGSAGYVSKNARAAREKHMVMRFETSDGKKGELQWGKDMLACVGGRGGTINAAYHESSTAEDPVAVLWGTDRSGKEYRNIVHLNDIDPGCATPAEMITLNAHLSKLDGRSQGNPIALWVSKNAGVNSEMDYEQYYRDYIALQQQSGNRLGADLCQLQLERLLFFHQQNRHTGKTSAETGYM